MSDHLGRTRRPTDRRRPALLALAAAVLLALLLGACGSSDDSGSDDAPSDATTDSAFPVTIPHAFGETTIAEEPTRVVTWGWGSGDAAIALGVVPVALPFDSYAGDAEGVLPWIREALEEQGEDVPTILPQSQDPPFEAIAAAQPDVILTPYSGITESDYELLSQIAPTVAYPGEAWSTPWQDVITIVGTALGRSSEAEGVLADIDAEVQAQADAHPEFQGKSVALVWNDPDAFYVYKPADARVQFTLDLGFENAPTVDDLSSGSETFYYTLSPERLGELTSDVLVSYADTAAAQESFLTSPQGQLMAQVRDGRVAKVNGTEFIAAVSPPTALSVTWGLDEFVAALAEAAAVADGAS